MPKSRIILQKILGSIKLLLNLAAGATAIATFLGFAGRLWWGFELLDHPRSQYCLILLSAFIIGSILRQSSSFFWCFPLAINLALILPLFFPSSSNFNEALTFPPDRTLRLIHANLDIYNKDANRAIKYLESQDVHLIFLQEVNLKWLTNLRSHLSRYRIDLSLPQENTQGVAMLVPVIPSKSIQILATQIIHLPPDSPRPLLETTILWESQKIAILNLSVIRSRNRETSSFQEIEFAAVADWSLRQKNENASDVIIIGDFNTTPWSSRFRQLLSNSKLINSQRGFGLQPTWPANLPSWFQIAIDHCLHSQSLTTLHRATGQNIGSDHLPILVEFIRKPG